MNEIAVQQSIAGEAQALLERLFPICRSITGEGVRETISILQETAPWQVKEYASGSQAYDWTVPKEWVIRDAWIADKRGIRIVDFRKNNLHVVGYSMPVRTRMAFDALRPCLHTLPDIPDAIPYRTTYYREAWGFCLSQRQLDAMDRNGEYEVVIDSELKDGALTLADCILPGQSGNEYLVSSYCCHPSMANDNVTGMVVATLLLRRLSQRKRLRNAWRFVLVPETIGAIVYLSQHENEMKRNRGGFVITTCGGPGAFGVKESFLGNHLVDRAVKIVARDIKVDLQRFPFAPDGSDERQYSSPGFRLPVTTITKDKYYEYPQYHTSLDNLNLVTGEAIAESFRLYAAAVDVIEQNRILKSGCPYGEAQLGRRGLYPQTGGALHLYGKTMDRADLEINALSWLLFLADGKHDLIDAAEHSNIPFRFLAEIANKLEREKLLLPLAG